MRFVASLGLFGMAFPVAVVAGENQEGSLDLVLGFGPVFPVGAHAEGFSTGFGGHGGIGVTAGGFGISLMMGSDEPATKDATNRAISIELGRPLEVSEAIVPVELQALYRGRLGSSPLVLGGQAGIGGASVTLRLKNTDARLSDTWHFGSSAGVSLGVRWRDAIIAAVCEYRRVFTTPDPTDYVTTRLQIAIPLIKG